MTPSIYFLSVLAHILAAVVWIGGMLFLVLVVVPALQRGVPPATRSAIIRDAGRRFRLVGWICLVVLAATGLANLAARGVSLAVARRPEFWETPFGGLLAVKLVLVAATLILSAAHDFWIGPRASRLLLSNPVPPSAARWRSAASLAGRLNLLLALAILALAIGLVRGWPWRGS